MATNNPKLYTPNEVMEIFSISRVTFSTWCRKGVLRKISIPGARRVFIDATDVQEMIEKRKSKALPK